jgi:hypothetical protein
MNRYLGSVIRSALAGLLAAGFAASVWAESMGAACMGHGCRAQDGTSIGGSCVGHYCGAGYMGGQCFGVGCQAGHGTSNGGDCYGDGCKAGDAWTVGGDCYGAGCTPGKGGIKSGAAKPFKQNMNCMMAEALMFPSKIQNFGGRIGFTGLSNYDTNERGWPDDRCRDATVPQPPPTVHINPALPPVPAPVVTITPLPPDEWVPKDGKCPYTCMRVLNGRCIGAPMNGC